MSSVKLDISMERLRGNLLIKAICFVAGAGIGFWLTQYLVRHLGVATFGLVPLATNISNYMAIVTVALSGSVGRFLVVDIAEGDRDSANQTFNTSLFASIVLAFLLLPVVAALAWFSPEILDVPAGEETGARWLLLGAGLAFLLNAIASSLAAPAFATNRLGLLQAVETMSVLCRALCVFVFFTLLGAALWQVGAATLTMALVGQSGYIILWRRLAPELRVNPRDFDCKKLREIVGMGGWLSVDRLGTLAFKQADLLVTNLVLGARAAGLYAPLLQVAILLQRLGATAADILTPTFIAYSVSGDKRRLISVLQQAFRTLGLTMALPVGLAAGLGEPLLRLWLGEEYAQLWPVLGIVTLHLCINVATTPFLGIQKALNRVLWPGIVTLIMGVANIALAVLLAGPAGWGLYGVAAAGAIVLTAKNVIFTLLYSSHILECAPTTFVRVLLPIVLSTVLVAGVARYVATVMSLSSWPLLVAVGLAIAAIYYPLAYRLGLNTVQRKRLQRLASTSA